MHRNLLAVAVLLGCLAMFAPNGWAQNNPPDVAGKWERREVADGKSYHIVKEHKDNRTTVTTFDNEENVVESHKSQYEIKTVGPVYLFIYSNLESTSGPNKGQTSAGPFAYVYRVEDDLFYEAQGLLSNSRGEPKVLVWNRVKK